VTRLACLPARSALGLLTLDDNGNCFEGNLFDTSFSTIGDLPACP